MPQIITQQSELIQHIVSLYDRKIPLKMRPISKEDPAITNAIYHPTKSQPKLYNSLKDAIIATSHYLSESGRKDDATKLLEYANNMRDNSKKSNEPKIHLPIEAYIYMLYDHYFQGKSLKHSVAIRHVPQAIYALKNKFKSYDKALTYIQNLLIVDERPLEAKVFNPALYTREREAQPIVDESQYIFAQYFNDFAIFEPQVATKPTLEENTTPTDTSQLLLEGILETPRVDAPKRQFISPPVKKEITVPRTLSPRRSPNLERQLSFNDNYMNVRRRLLEARSHRN